MDYSSRILNRQPITQSNPQHWFSLHLLMSDNHHVLYQVAEAKLTHAETMDSIKWSVEIEDMVDQVLLDDMMDISDYMQPDPSLLLTSNVTVEEPMDDMPSVSSPKLPSKSTTGETNPDGMANMSACSPDTTINIPDCSPNNRATIPPCSVCRGTGEGSSTSYGKCHR